jgi:hypothetical protein
MQRFDTLTPIHKALRALVYEVGGDLQTADFDDELEAAGTAADLELALRLMRDHHTTEEVYFYPKLQPFEAQLVATMLEQHENVVQLLDVTEEARGQLRAAGAEGRTDAGADLNRRFNELVAVYFEHLAEEESEVLPATWRHFDDTQLMAIQGAIIAEMDPDALFQWLGWMFKGLNRAELVGILRGAKAGMPSEALDAVRRLARRAWRLRPGSPCGREPASDPDERWPAVSSRSRRTRACATSKEGRHQR